MINKEIEKKINNFINNKLSEVEKRYKSLEILRQKFVEDYPINRIMNLTKKEYGVGLGKENKSFCYRVETELKDLGDIHGSTSYKFGLYYDKKEHKAGNDTINFAKRFGNNEDEVFDNIKNNIVNLIKAGENNDSENISKNPISPMFKGKILSILPG